MDTITEANKALFAQCVRDYYDWVLQYIFRPVENYLGFNPGVLVTLTNELSKLRLLIEHMDLSANTSIDALLEKNQSYLKRAIFFTIQQRTFDIERRIELTDNPEVKSVLEAEVQEIQGLSTGGWFANIEAYKSPKLTDFLTLQKASEYESNELKPRQYDEKFHTLMAQSLFPSDIRYYRSACELRGRPVTLGFLDIDDFKTFNEKYTEPQVDLLVLPKFMSELEAHTYSLGHAYRYAGDEYVVLLPNMLCTTACQLLVNFQQALTEVDYYGVDKKPTVSIGVMEIDGECPLTDKECLNMAVNAKDHAKAQRRGSIYINKGSSPNDETFEEYSNADTVELKA